MSQQINLFNPIFLKQKKYFSAAAMLQALGLILVGAILLVVYASIQSDQLGKEASATSNQLASTLAQLAKINTEFKPRQKSKALEDDIQKAEVEVAALQHVFGILDKGDFGNTKGYSEYLRAFARQSVDGLWLTGFNILGAGNEIGLQGRVLQAELVPAYISRLGREPVMRGKSFSSLEMQVARAEETGKDGAGTKPGKQAAYIDFTLQSSAAVKDAAASSDAKNK